LGVPLEFIYMTIAALPKMKVSDIFFMGVTGGPSDLDQR
jgi:hypothetical protein